VLSGIVVYNSWLKRVRLRPMMLWGSLLGCALGLTPLMLVEGLNRKLGISDRLFALVDSALLSSVGQVGAAYCVAVSFVRCFSIVVMCWSKHSASCGWPQTQSGLQQSIFGSVAFSAAVGNVAGGQGAACGVYCFVSAAVVPCLVLAMPCANSVQCALHAYASWPAVCM
jgi:hypothetical protein